MEYKKIRGTEDLYYKKSEKYIEIYNAVFEIAKKYNFSFIKTPSLEEEKLFKHTISESDIVTKEMFKIVDKKGRNIVLKPEGTAPIVRAIVENKIIYDQKKPIKLFYLDSMFRYERPQKGRMRQFNQFGFEIIGSNNIYYDAELIIILKNIFEKLNINVQKLSLQVNYLGSNETRIEYIKSLKKYLLKLNLCNDCKNKLNKNILRILDCKIDKKNIEKAPKILDFLNDDEKIEYKKYLNILDENNIEYSINPYLVRGLDYYKNIVFEIIYNEEEWSQNSICGGGRYDDLFQKFNINTFGVGFALGIERLMMIMKENQNKIKHFYIGSLDEISSKKCFQISNLIRKYNYIVINDYEINLNKHFKNIDHYNTEYNIIIGPKDIENNTITINSKKKKKYIIKIDELERWLNNENI